MTTSAISLTARQPANRMMAKIEMGTHIQCGITTFSSIAIWISSRQLEAIARI